MNLYPPKLGKCLSIPPEGEVIPQCCGGVAIPLIFRNRVEPLLPGDVEVK